MEEVDVDDVVRRFGAGFDIATAEVLRDLIQQAVDLGATAEEIEASVPLRLGPLALDLAIRAPGPAMTIEEFAAQSGLPAELVGRMWRAFGLLETRPTPRPVTVDAGEALKVVYFLVDALGEDATLGFARVVGVAAAQMADALANMVRIGVEVPQRDTAPPSQLSREYAATARDLLPFLWDAIGAIFRRHLVLVSNQEWDSDESGAAITLELTVGFVDLVGSTDVLRGLTIAALADQVDGFERLIWDVVTRAGGRVVKLIGDEAMFVVDRPDVGSRMALELVGKSPNPLRVGMAHGSVVAFHGDYYGPTVNLAARLVSIAPNSAVLVSESAARGGGGGLAAGAGGVAFEPVPTGQLRGFPDVTTAYRVIAPS